MLQPTVPPILLEAPEEEPLDVFDVNEDLDDDEIDDLLDAINDEEEFYQAYFVILIIVYAALLFALLRWQVGIQNTFGEMVVQRWLRMYLWYARRTMGLWAVVRIVVTMCTRVVLGAAFPAWVGIVVVAFVCGMMKLCVGDGVVLVCVSG
ncbi:hypothetical protein DPSP01_002079 [Paraphaeosphaeria sporulosa]